MRLKTEADIPMLHEWLQRPHVVQWWGGEDERPALEQTRVRYLPRVLAEEQLTPYIAMLDSRPMPMPRSTWRWVVAKAGGRTKPTPP